MGKWLWLLLPVFLFTSCLPVAEAAKTVEYFCGFECESDGESTEENVTTAANIKDTVDTPWEGVEDWYLYLPDAATNKYWQGTPYWTCDDATEQIYGGYFRFENDITPQGDLDFLAATTDKGEKHWYLQLHSSGNLSVRDANEVLLCTVVSPFTLSTWYLIEARWKKHNTTGYVVVRIDGVEVCNVTGEDTYYGAATDCTIRLEGQDGPQGNPTQVLINSCYALYDTAGDDDFLGPFQVWGPDTTDHATGNSDDGANLTVGNWENLAEIPPSGINTASIGDNTSGRKRCNGGFLSGLNDDGIVGASYVAVPSVGNSRLQYGRFDGDYDYATDTQALTNRSDNGIVFLTCPSANCPTASDDFLIGMSDPGGDSLPSTWVEAFAFILYDVPEGRVTLINSPMRPNTLVGAMP
jgi:hypothetical protein